MRVTQPFLYSTHGQWFVAHGETTYGPYDSETSAQKVARTVWLERSGQSVDELGFLVLFLARMLGGGALLLLAYCVTVWLATLALQ